MGEVSNLKLIRIRSGLSQAELSELLGIPKRTIENYESGSRVPPNWVMDLLCEHIINHSLRKENYYDKNHGVYSLLELRNLLGNCLNKYDIEFATITGDYISGDAKVNSEVCLDLFSNDDLLIPSIKNDLEKYIHKNCRLNLINTSKLDINTIKEIERRGLRIYEK